MASRHLRLGPISVALSANRQGAELGLRWEGPSWTALLRHVRPLPAGIQRRGNVGDASGVGVVPPLPLPKVAPADPADRRRLVESVNWYHSFDFGDGVNALGQFDHRPYLQHYCLPKELHDKRVLDVATFDGFWAFEFERRGAGEVVALDIDSPYELDWPPAIRAQAGPLGPTPDMGCGFKVARLLKGSRVRREVCNVYELDPQRFGMFDLVHVGDLLLHLNSPIRALQRIANVCRGEALISEVVHPDVAIGNEPRVLYRGGHHDVTWWSYSPEALRRMVLDAGFRKVEVLSKFMYGQRDGRQNMHHVVMRATK